MTPYAKSCFITSQNGQGTLHIYTFNGYLRNDFYQMWPQSKGHRTCATDYLPNDMAPASSLGVFKRLNNLPRWHGGQESHGSCEEDGAINSSHDTTGQMNIRSASLLPPLYKPFAYCPLINTPPTFHSEYCLPLRLNVFSTATVTFSLRVVSAFYHQIAFWWKIEKSTAKLNWHV